jgi:hypothetical protein
MASFRLFQSLESSVDAGATIQIIPPVLQMTFPPGDSPKE